MTKEKVILAYSGGLDTSVILQWLIDKGYDVVAYMLDIGQKEDFKAAEQKAKKIGASKVYFVDAKKEFITDFVFPAIRANAKYEGRYLMGTSLARPLIAKKQIEIAKKENATIVAHGATGKGNDQVRFELAYLTLMPSVKIIAPWKDKEFLAQFQGRSDMIDYCNEKGIPVEATKKKPYSSDANIMHISYEAGILEDPSFTPTEDMFKMTISPKKAADEETELEIEFEKGNPVKVTNLNDGAVKENPLELFKYLNEVGGKNGIGRIDMVEDRFVGMKSRGVYETPAGTILHEAHRDIEGLTMDREVMLLRDSLIPKFAQLVYSGFWFSPEMDFLRNAFDYTQQYVNGKVKLGLYKGNLMIKSRESSHSLYNKDIVSMDIHGGYDQTDAIGFIRLNALRLKASANRLKK